MRKLVSSTCAGLSVFPAMLALAVFFVISGGASAQTIITLNQPGTQVTDQVTIRDGGYSGTNLGGQTLQSKTYSTDHRRILLKFDTSDYVPAGANVTKARLVMTLKSAGSDAYRNIAAYWAKRSFAQSQATWNVYRTSYSWTTPGGDVGSQYSVTSVGNKPGSYISFDVTALVQAAVSGSLGSRWTRIELVDMGTASANSLREFYTSATAGCMPKLEVTIGSAAPPPPPPTGSTTLKVFQWNIQFGQNTSGVMNLDQQTTDMAAAHPDVINLNEVETGCSRGDEPTIIKNYLQQKTGQTWYMYYAHFGPLVNTCQVNLLLSRFPIQSTSSIMLYNDHIFIHITIVVNGRTINVFGTHLDAWSSSARLTQISQMKSYMSGFAEQRIVAGDFNMTQGSSEWNAMDTSYSDSWYVAYANGTAVSYPGNPYGNTRNGRIDYVWYSHGASSLSLKSCQVFDTGGASDHRPVMATFAVN